MSNAASFINVRLASIWLRNSGCADHSRAMAPEMCGVAMEVPLANV
jgi:hypothetical protein